MHLLNDMHLLSKVRLLTRVYGMWTDIYNYTWLLGMRVYVRPLPDVLRRIAASPLTSHVTKGGHIVVVLSYHKVEVEQQLQGHDRSNSRVPGAHG